MTNVETTKDSLPRPASSSGKGVAIGRPRIPRLREKILLSAKALFADKGFDGVLVDEIAAHAGVGKGSIYRQFSSKEEIYTATVIQGYVDLRSRILAEVKSTKSPSQDVITAIVSQIVSYFWERLVFFDLLRDRSRLPPTYESRYRNARRNLVRTVGGVLAQGAKDGQLRKDLDSHLLAESLLGMIRGILRYQRGAVSLSQEEVVHTIVSVFLEGCSRQHAFL